MTIMSNATLDTTRETDFEVPADFQIFPIKGGFEELVGPLYHTVRDGQWIFGVLVKEHHTNPLGSAHGGFLATFADHFVNGLAFHALDRRPCATVSLGAEYMMPVRAGQWIEGRGEVVHQSRSLIFIRGTITCGDAIVATTTAICRMRVGF